MPKVAQSRETGRSDITITTEDVKRARENARIGGVVDYLDTRLDESRGFFVRHWIKVYITGIYPNLITVTGRRPLPIRSITYKELLLNQIKFGRMQESGEYE